MKSRIESPSPLELLLWLLTVVALAAAVLAASLAVTSALVYAVWNYVVAPAFGAPDVTLIQSAAAAIAMSVAGLFFGGRK